MKTLLSRFLHETQASQLIEYALLAVLIALVGIAAIVNRSGALNGKDKGITGALPRPAGLGRAP
jgi:Flp pilus assembly pilin Flp